MRCFTQWKKRTVLSSYFSFPCSQPKLFPLSLLTTITCEITHNSQLFIIHNPPANKPPPLPPTTAITQRPHQCDTSALEVMLQSLVDFNPSEFGFIVPMKNGDVGFSCEYNSDWKNSWIIQKTLTLSWFFWHLCWATKCNVMKMRMTKFEDYECAGVFSLFINL